MAIILSFSWLSEIPLPFRSRKGNPTLTPIRCLRMDKPWQKPLPAHCSEPLAGCSLFFSPFFPHMPDNTAHYGAVRFQPRRSRASDAVSDSIRPHFLRNLLLSTGRACLGLGFLALFCLPCQCGPIGPDVSHFLALFMHFITNTTQTRVSITSSLRHGFPALH